MPLHPSMGVDTVALRGQDGHSRDSRARSTDQLQHCSTPNIADHAKDFDRQGYFEALLKRTWHQYLLLGLWRAEWSKLTLCEPEFTTAAFQDGLG